MDVDNDFLKPTHESMEVNSAQPNIVAGSSQNIFSGSHPAGLIMSIFEGFKLC